MKNFLIIANITISMLAMEHECRLWLLHLASKKENFSVQEILDLASDNSMGHTITINNGVTMKYDATFSSKQLRNWVLQDNIAINPPPIMIQFGTLPPQPLVKPRNTKSVTFACLDKQR